MEKQDKSTDFLGVTGLAMVSAGFFSNLLRLTVSRRRKPHRTTNGLLSGITVMMGGIACWMLYWMTHYEAERKRADST